MVTRNCPQQETAFSCLEGELHDDAFASHAHHRCGNPWAGMGKCHVIREAFEIGCLASPFVLSSEWLAAPAWLAVGHGRANPTVEALQLWIWPSASATLCESVDCLRRSLEFCIILPPNDGHSGYLRKCRWLCLYRGAQGHAATLQPPSNSCD